MKRSVGIWQLMGFAVTSLGGTLLHFLYDWSGEAAFIAPFSGVNESTWEHIKILFWPVFIYAVIQSLFFREYKNFWCVKLRGALLGLMLIPVMFYTYNGAVGKSPDWLNIAIFFISTFILYLYEANQLDKESFYFCSSRLSFAILCVIGFLFIFFTFNAPHLAIFKDPLTSAYGI